EQVVAHARRLDDAGAQAFDVSLCDTQGRVCVVIRGFTLHSLRRDTGGGETVFVAPAWTDSGEPVPLAGLPAGVLLLAGEPSSLADTLSDALAMPVRPVAVGGEAAEGLYVDPAAAGGWARLMDTVFDAAGDGPGRMVYLCRAADPL